MGVVTGEVPSGTAIKNSALFQLAKGRWPFYTTVVPVAEGMTWESPNHKGFEAVSNSAASHLLEPACDSVHLYG